MFCPKCGAKNDDGAIFCNGCGNKFDNNQDLSSDAVTLRVNDKKYKTVGIIAVSIICTFFVVLGIVLFGGRGYKKTVNKFIEATFEADGKKVVSLVNDKYIDAIREDFEDEDMEEWVDELIEDGEIKDKKEMIDYLVSVQLGEFLDDFLWSDEYLSKYEIVRVEDLDDDEIDYIREDYESYIDVDLNISAAKKVKVKLTISGEDEDRKETIDVYVIKVGVSWYIDPFSTDDVFC